MNYELQPPFVATHLHMCDISLFLPCMLKMKTYSMLEVVSKIWLINKHLWKYNFNATKYTVGDEFIRRKLSQITRYMKVFEAPQWLLCLP